METYKQKRISLNRQTNPNSNEEDININPKHLPVADSTCNGLYGPTKKRQDGTFGFMKSDYGMAGIAHIPTVSTASTERTKIFSEY